MSSNDGGKKKAAASSSRPTGGIRTLADLTRGPSNSGSDSDSDGPQEYYTGGEKSGMLVQDPTKGNPDVDAIFEQARKMGAQQGPFEDPPSSSRSFTGTGRLLSGATIPSHSQLQPENIVHNIFFWTNGFSVDDGPLRTFDDPANAPFLESIQKSECPKELQPEDSRAGIHVNLIRREEAYKEPVRSRSQIAFQGVGRTLGSGTNSGSTCSVPSSGVTRAASSPITFSVDDSKPSTSIQLRLADGTRMVARFNNHHTVAEIRAFIDASRAGGVRNYHLQTVGFPPKQLTDVSLTLEQAGLLNSVIIQKL